VGSSTASFEGFEFTKKAGANVKIGGVTVVVLVLAIVGSFRVEFGAGLMADKLEHFVASDSFLDRAVMSFILLLVVRVVCEIL
jgi:hypothetical protein